MGKKETKCKILDCAVNLFAKKGYAQTSVRDISESADVNVASINYHFGNKEALLQDVLKHSFEEVGEMAKNLSSTFNGEFDEFIGLFFGKLLKRHGDHSVNCFKIAINQDLPMQDYGLEDERIGPPGSQIIYNQLEKSLKNKVTKEDLIWAVRTISSLMFHLILLRHSSFSKKSHVKEVLMNETYLLEGVKRHARVIHASLESGIR